MQPTLSKHDWPEDFKHDNGMYYCRCIECKERFIGYKRRMICKSCYWDNTTKELEYIKTQFIPEGKDVTKEIKDQNYKLRMHCIEIGKERYKMAKVNKSVL
jgi:hypothetical protein